MFVWIDVHCCIMNLKVEPQFCYLEMWLNSVWICPACIPCKCRLMKPVRCTWSNLNSVCGDKSKALNEHEEMSFQWNKIFFQFGCCKLTCCTFLALFSLARRLLCILCRGVDSLLIHVFVCMPTHIKYGKIYLAARLTLSLNVVEVLSSSTGEGNIWRALLRNASAAAVVAAAAVPSIFLLSRLAIRKSEVFCCTHSLWSLSFSTKMRLKSVKEDEIYCAPF